MIKEVKVNTSTPKVFIWAKYYVPILCFNLKIKSFEINIFSLHLDKPKMSQTTTTKKPSWNNSDSLEITFTGGFRAKSVTEKRTLGLWLLFAIHF